MTNISKYVALKEYIPSGDPQLSHFEIREEKINIDYNNNVFIKNEWISVDPYMRARMTERKNYKPPFELNKPMEGAAIGRVLESNTSTLSPGDIVRSDYGWRDQFVASNNDLIKIDSIDVPIQTYLGPLGFTGHTAYIGLFRIGELK